MPSTKCRELIRRILYTATLKDGHYKSVLHDEQGLFLLRPPDLINPESLIKGVSSPEKAELSLWKAFFTKRFEITSITLATKFPVW